MKELAKFTFTFFLLLSFMGLALSQIPTFPHRFQGQVTVHGESVNYSEIVPYDFDTGEALPSEGYEIPAPGTSPPKGYYTLIIKEGSWENIIFKIGDYFADQDPVAYSSGESTNLDLSVGITDKDEDGIEDENDFIIGTIDDVQTQNVDDLHFELKPLEGNESNKENPNNHDGLAEVTFKDGYKELFVFEFQFGPDVPDNQLDLSKLKIFVNSDDDGSIIINGLDLTDQGRTKTVYFQKMLSSNTICIFDVDDAEISVSGDCTNGVKLSCPEEKEGYSCVIEEKDEGVFVYEVSGLSHSAVTEYKYTPPSSGSSSRRSSGGSFVSSTPTPTPTITPSPTPEESPTPTPDLTVNEGASGTPTPSPKEEVNEDATLAQIEPTPDSSPISPGAPITGAFTGGGLGGLWALILLILIIVGLVIFAFAKREKDDKDYYFDKAAKLHKKAEAAHRNGNEDKAIILEQKSEEYRAKGEAKL